MGWSSCRLIVRGRMTIGGAVGSASGSSARGDTTGAVIGVAVRDEVDTGSGSGSGSGAGEIGSGLGLGADSIADVSRVGVSSEMELSETSVVSVDLPVFLRGVRGFLGADGSLGARSIR